MYKLTFLRPSALYRSVLLILLLTLAVLPAATRAAREADTVSVDIDVAHLAFPPVIPAGLARITAINSGKSVAETSVARLAPGVTPQQAQSALDKANGDATQAPKIFTLVGGIAGLAPHRKAAVTLSLTPGTYEMLSYVDTLQTLSFTVSPGSNVATDVTPKATASITLQDGLMLGMPKRLPAGVITLKVHDRGHDIHLLLLLGVQPGRTAKDMAQLLATNSDLSKVAWIRSIVGLDWLSLGQTAWLSATLTAGSYMAVAAPPNPAGVDGVVIHAFTVS